MEKLHGFTLSGKPLKVGGPSPLVARGIKYLNSLPFGKLLTTTDLGVALRTAPDTLRQLFNTNDTLHLRARVVNNGTRKMVYGSPRTIAALRKRLGEAANATDL